MAPLTVQPNEICKVRNAAVGRTGAGYSIAIINKTNKASVSISLIESGHYTQTFAVNLDTLWKLKASQRKTFERKLAKANAPTKQVVAPPVQVAPPTVASLYIGVEHLTPLTVGTIEACHSLKCTTKLRLASDVNFFIAHDSVVKFTGDAIVNAANEGCLGGGGIDGEINFQGGMELEKARYSLPFVDGSSYKRCATGDAKITIAGKLPCKFVIHAVGPRFGYGDDHNDDLERLDDAYKSCMQRACEAGLKTIAFCILSGGIYRGGCPLKTVIKRGMDAIAKNTYPGLSTIIYSAFTPGEQDEMNSIISDIEKQIK